MTGKLAGAVACITGAGNGIGRATAELFAREGAIVFATDIDGSSGEALAAEISAVGGRASFMVHDVTDETAWREVAATIAECFGRLDILINNAGIGLSGPVTEIAYDDWRKVIAVNLDGAFLGIKHCLPLMRRTGGGSIVNVSSIAGIKPSANASAYSASKGAVRMLTKAVALECGAAGDGVRVNSIHPGIVDTAIWDDLLPARSPAEAGAERSQVLTQLTTSSIPLGRVGSVGEIAAAILWLASSESSYVTGAELVIDGGRSIN